MEKEVRAIIEKGEKVTLVAIDECVMNGNENQKALITNKEYEIIDFCEGMFCIDSEITSKHQFYIKNINKYFKLKQPKDPNELIGRKVKGFEYQFMSVESMFDYIGKIGEIIRFDGNDYKVLFEDGNYWYYPKDEIMEHVV